MRFLYACNILLPGGLAVLHLANPRMAADRIWGGGGMSFQGSPAVLALPMLGAWWAGIALLSVLGLRSPLKYRRAAFKAGCGGSCLLNFQRHTARPLPELHAVCSECGSASLHTACMQSINTQL
jgi:hypothetical protein